MEISTHAPAGGATKPRCVRGGWDLFYFYSRPCGRGDLPWMGSAYPGGVFLLTPLREGRRVPPLSCSFASQRFLLTPLREGRHGDGFQSAGPDNISTHAPAGGATKKQLYLPHNGKLFLLTPLREGRPGRVVDLNGAELFLLTPLREGRRRYRCSMRPARNNFYSRPCGRGDCNFPQVRHEVLRQIAER